jgi:hypothetical protein
VMARLNAITLEPDSAALVTQIAQLRARNDVLEQQNSLLEARVTAQERHNAVLEERFTALEQASRSHAAAGRPADSGIPTNWLLFGGIILLGVVALRRRP